MRIKKCQEKQTYNYRRTSGISWLRPSGIVSNWELTTVMMCCWCSCCFSLVLLAMVCCSCFRLSMLLLLFLMLALQRFRHTKIQRFGHTKIHRYKFTIKKLERYLFRKKMIQGIEIQHNMKYKDIRIKSRQLDCLYLLPPFPRLCVVELVVSS